MILVFLVLIFIVCNAFCIITSSYISPLIKISQIQGKGIGIIANEFIQAGTLLIEERPLFTLKTLQIRMTEDMEIERVDKKVQGLNDEERESYYSLHAYNKRKSSLNAYSRALDIFRTNAYPTGTNDTAGIFLLSLVSTVNAIQMSIIIIIKIEALRLYMLFVILNQKRITKLLYWAIFTTTRAAILSTGEFWI